MTSHPLARRPWAILLAASLAGGAVVGGARALAPVLARLGAEWSPAWQEAVFAALLYGALALLALVGRRLTGPSGLGADDRTGSAAWVGLGAAIGVGGMVAALADAALAGLARPGGGGGNMVALLGGTVVVLGQSASEELFFRGWIQPALASRWRPWTAIAATALAFALLHVAGGARSPLTLVNLCLGGVLFGLLRWRSGGLAAAIAAHAGWNWAEAILFGLDPNPGVGAFGAIRDLDLVGMARWGGSGEGLNASVAMTLVLIALILPLAGGVRRGVSPAAARG